MFFYLADLLLHDIFGFAGHGEDLVEALKIFFCEIRIAALGDVLDERVSKIFAVDAHNGLLGDILTESAQADPVEDIVRVRGASDVVCIRVARCDSALDLGWIVRLDIHNEGLYLFFELIRLDLEDSEYLYSHIEYLLLHLGRVELPNSMDHGLAEDLARSDAV